MTVKRIIKKIINRISINYFKLYDHKYDMKYCGCDLSKPIDSVFRNDNDGVGYTGSYSTCYKILDIVFDGVELKDDDRFIDVGCGKGRVLSYLVGKNEKCSINGIEINEEAGACAAKWAERFNNVTVLIGDAFNINCNEYDIFFFGRPFLPKTFQQFIEKMEAELTHPIKFIYFVDQQSRYIIENRDGWIEEKSGEVYKYKGLYLAYQPQGYSHWTYTPAVKK